MKTIYLAIIDELKKISEIRWIDLDTGQLSTNDRAPIATPAALIEIILPECKSLTDLAQVCKARITVRLIFDKTSLKTSANTPEASLAKNLEVYDIIAKVYAALQGFESNTFSAMSRKNQGASRISNYFVYRIEFECEFEDQTAE
ncbi:MAG: hypothetical protein A2X19_02745 [Bacteroidetes bacterium GWE2_39_28]|nr:MAG: hypothetical protein A2X19_02745 [Bacteroidetes bacterium GWE2_39_28]OFY16009.1 MAG: hypothetical protein A2X16_09905 [Bacteroidetes bacterium GWF2_39_10]OFZ07010.1 MAG: hypothetical protein A2322_08560 [Bacteroidetes bacterium RIFOXYB2_FULL_39_7]OFZ09564.1 MAG: hypothetical protein A2465_04960 [Bacteroidetes bacterium RIFOXYC2_FULL_39_11]HCT94363.1 hypothetical protein [Rikenellaceae bacterium]